MDPKEKRVPETEESEFAEVSDDELIEDEPSARDTIPPEGPIITTNSIPPGDPDIEQVLLEESVDAWFDAVRMPDISEDDPDEAAFERMLEEQAKKKKLT